MNVLGIDPGASTGLAYICDGKLQHVRTVAYGDDGAKVLDTIKSLLAFSVKGETVVVVEEPARPYFERSVSRRANYRIAGNVGECRAKAHAIAGMLRALGVEVELRKPLRGGTKRAISPERWRLIFSEYAGRTSNHGRDAAMLALRIYQERRFLAGEKWHG